MKFINCLNLFSEVVSTASEGKLFHNLIADGKKECHMEKSYTIFGQLAL